MYDLDWCLILYQGGPFSVILGSLSSKWRPPTDVQIISQIKQER
jgi:hypothetical protein